MLLCVELLSYSINCLGSSITEGIVSKRKGMAHLSGIGIKGGHTTIAYFLARYGRIIQRSWKVITVSLHYTAVRYDVV